MEKEIINIINDMKKYSYLQSPYLYDGDDIKKVSVEDVVRILETETEGIGYFTDDDAVDGGIIERMAIRYDKKLPEDNDFDMRDYYSFFIKGTDYSVFFIDSWPEKD